MCIAGVPLFLLEASVGQFSSKSAVSMWSVVPILKGRLYSKTLPALLFSTLMILRCFLFNVTFKMIVSQHPEIELRCPSGQLYPIICQASVSNFNSISSLFHKLQERKHRVQNNGERGFESWRHKTREYGQ